MYGTYGKLKRYLAMLLSILMLVTALPISALAEGGDSVESANVEAPANTEGTEDETPPEPDPVVPQAPDQGPGPEDPVPPVVSAPEPTPTDTPEPTAVPTDTPEPTAVPTDTPEPTAVPTDTPEPTDTTVLYRYLFG